MDETTLAGAVDRLPGAERLAGQLDRVTIGKFADHAVLDARAAAAVDWVAVRIEDRADCSHESDRVAVRARAAIRQAQEFRRHVAAGFGRNDLVPPETIAIRNWTFEDLDLRALRQAGEDVAARPRFGAQIDRVAIRVRD